MALETATYLSDLVAENPPGTDSKSQGDDHLRLIKATLQATFPNAIGPRKLSDDTDGASDVLNFTLYKNRTAAGTPDANDALGSFVISGNNEAHAEHAYFRLRGFIASPTNGSEGGMGQFLVMRNGTEYIAQTIRGDTNTTIFYTEIEATRDINAKTKISIDKAASGGVNDLWGRTGGEQRWLVRLGDQTAETGVRDGSNFSIYCYDNTGTSASAIQAMFISRTTGVVTFPVGISTPSLTTTDPLLTLGPSTVGSTFAMQRPIGSGDFRIYGGSSTGDGAYLQLFGSTQTPNGSDIILGTTGVYRYFYDFSADTHIWRNTGGTASMSFSTLGDLAITRNLVAGGSVIADGIVKSSTTTIIVAPSAAGTIKLRPGGEASTTGEAVLTTAGFSAVTIANLTLTDPVLTAGSSTLNSNFSIQRPVSTGSLSLHSGTGGATGAFLNLYGDGQTLGSAGDFGIGTEGAYRYYYDYGANLHQWHQTALSNAMQLNASGDLTILGQMDFDSILQSSDTSCILAAASGGSVYLRPNGAGSTSEQCFVDTSGNWNVGTGRTLGGVGYNLRAGSAGAYNGAAVFNVNWVDGVGTQMWIGTTAFTLAVTSDHRNKKDVKALKSMWDRIRSLRPISYKSTSGGRERWGFVAHELQDTLTSTAAVGERDCETPQSLDMTSVFTLLAATVTGLKEAMERIEILEAKVVV